MLRLYEGEFSSVAREAVIEDIKRRVDKKERVYLVVPEQQTLLTELEMANILPSYAPLCFEVTNFPRLANTVFRVLGGISEGYCTKGVEALIMWRTLTELGPYLSTYTGKDEINTGTVERCLAAIHEMSGLSIKSEDLLAAAEKEKVSNFKRLQDKLTDLSKIMALYKKILSENYSDMTEDLYALCEKLKENRGFFKDSSFYFIGYTSFTEPQYRLLDVLIGEYDVAVHLEMPRHAKDYFEYRELTETENRLENIGKKSGSQIFKYNKFELSDGQNITLTNAAKLLWHSSGALPCTEDEPGEAVRIFRAKDSYREADFIASDIKRRVMLGASYSDFAILTRDIEKYSHIIKSSLDNTGIDAFLSIKRDVFSFEAVKLINNAFQIVKNNFRREDVISYMKCGLSDISMEACDEFQLYTSVWNINGERFYDGVAWNMNPGGFVDKLSEEDKKILLSVNETRKKIIGPLVKLKSEFSECRTVREFAAALIKFLSQAELEKMLLERCRMLVSLSLTESAKFDSQLWGIICSSLDTLVSVMGECKTDLGGFVSQLNILFSQININKIPTYRDQVIVAQADIARLPKKKYVYLMGVNRGEFPMSVKENSYFSERDKAILEEYGIGMKPDLEIKYARELFFFSRAFSLAEEGVTLTYSERSTDFSPSEKAEIIDRICEIFNGKVVPTDISSLPLTERLYQPGDAIEALREAGPDEYRQIKDALTNSGYDREVSVCEKNIKNTDLALSEDTARDIYRSDITLSSSKLDTYMSCPLRYFLTYNLRLNENREAVFDLRNVGNLVHEIMEHFFTDMKKSGIDFDTVTEEDILNIAKLGKDKYINKIFSDESISKKRIDAFVNRIITNTVPMLKSLCEEFKGSKYRPCEFEFPVGTAEGAKAHSVKCEDGTRIFLKGIIDRVDIFRCGNDVYLRIIDYKTGGKKLSKKDIEKGKNLQMLLYLTSLCEEENRDLWEKWGVTDGGKAIPAGAIYINPALNDRNLNTANREEIIKEIFKLNNDREGIILNDENNLAAISRDISPITFKKDGELTKNSLSHVYDIEEWDEIKAEIDKQIASAATQMKSGRIDTKSLNKTSLCDFCQYKPVCRKGNYTNDNN